MKAITPNEKLVEDLPLPVRDINEEFKEEISLIREATDFAISLIMELQPTTEEIIKILTTDEFNKILTTDEFIKILTNKFGFNVRLCLFDIVDELRANLFTAGYAAINLTDDQLEQVLQGLMPSQRQKDESTLDELFARSISLRTPQKLIEVVNFVAKLKEYAPYNNMLVYLQRPIATHWATASHWKKAFKRTVRPEAIPIIILQPMGPVMLVYDVDDTEGEPLPPTIGNLFTVSGEFDLSIYAKTVENCKRIGIHIKEVALSSTHAGTAIRQSPSEDIKLVIELNQAHSIKTKYATLCHEIAHILLGHLGGDPKGKEWNSRIMLNRNQRELEAEATCYLVCFRAGLFSKSAEYLSIYLTNKDDLTKISIDLIMKTAGYIERMGKETIRPKTKEKKNQK